MYEDRYISSMGRTQGSWRRLSFTVVKTRLAQTGEKTEYFNFNVSKSCILSCYIHQNLHKQVHTENLYQEYEESYLIETNPTSMMRGFR